MGSRAQGALSTGIRFAPSCPACCGHNQAVKHPVGGTLNPGAGEPAARAEKVPCPLPSGDRPAGPPPAAPAPFPGALSVLGPRGLSIFSPVHRYRALLFWEHPPTSPAFHILLPPTYKSFPETHRRQLLRINPAFVRRVAFLVSPFYLLVLAYNVFALRAVMFHTSNMSTLSLPNSGFPVWLK